MVNCDDNSAHSRVAVEEEMESANSGGSMAQSSSDGDAEEDYVSSLHPRRAGSDSVTLLPYNPLSAAAPPPPPYFDPLATLFNPCSGARPDPIPQPAPAAGRNPRKRTRASRRAPTTVLTTDTSNFRAMVQEFTGIPASPFAAASSSASSNFRARLDHLFGGGGSSRGLFPDLPGQHHRQPYQIRPPTTAADVSNYGQLPVPDLGLISHIPSSNFPVAATAGNQHQLINWAEEGVGPTRSAMNAGGNCNVNRLHLHPSFTGSGSGAPPPPDRCEGMPEYWICSTHH